MVWGWAVPALRRVPKGKTAPLGHLEPIRRDAGRRRMIEPQPRAALEMPQPLLLFQFQIVSLCHLAVHGQPRELVEMAAAFALRRSAPQRTSGWRAEPVRSSSHFNRRRPTGFTAGAWWVRQLIAATRPAATAQRGAPIVWNRDAPAAPEATNCHPSRRAVPSRYATRFNTPYPRLVTDSRAVSGLCSDVLHSSFVGRPRPLHGFGSSGPSPARHMLTLPCTRTT